MPRALDVLDRLGGGRPRDLLRGEARRPRRRIGLHGRILGACEEKVQKPCERRDLRQPTSDSRTFLKASVFALLFGGRQVAPETLLIGRVAGAAVISIGVASWPARRDSRTPAQLGVLAGRLTYNVLAALLLAFAGAGICST